MAKTVVIAGALDTKGQEVGFVRQLIQARGINTLLVDFGVLGEPGLPADISNEEVALAGGSDLLNLRSSKDKSEAMRAMAAGLTVIVRRLHEEGRLQGILSLGGSGGTAIATAGMRALPVGIPKLMVSTVAGSDASGYVGTRDITMMPSVVDVAGFNRISRRIYANAAGAIVGMVENEVEAKCPANEKPLIAASMFGNTTPCIDRARAILEGHGYEVLVFHATGKGGRTMQALVEDGYIQGLLDLTTTELADEVCGGIFSAGPERVRLASQRNVPLLLAPGCVDMCNFWERSTVPERYQKRHLYEWNPNVTLMRTNPEENVEIGKMLAETANECHGPVAILIPLEGVSMLDSRDKPFWDPEADQSCFNAIKRNLRDGIPVVELSMNINDPRFADKAVEVFLDLIGRAKQVEEVG
jgi:uncharacterized protein (UPF0261 family)